MAAITVPVSNLRRDTARLLRRTHESDEPVYITRYGRPKAVLLGYQVYERLMAQLEELVDLDSLRERADEPVRLLIEFLQEVGEESRYGVWSLEGM
jgi:prevent-host-death family protein